MMNINSPFFHEQKAERDFSNYTGLICICGCGTIGANLAETLARIGIKRLRLIDNGRINARNISGQPWIIDDIGQQKVKILSHKLYHATFCRADAHFEKLTNANIDKLLCDATLIIDCFDNAEARRSIHQFKHDAILHCGFADADYGEVIWNEKYIVPELSIIDPCDYPSTRSMMHLLVAIATESIISYIQTGTKRSATITRHDLSIKEF